MKILCLAAALVLVGCDRPAPPPREEPKPEKESTFSGFQTQTSGTPLPLQQAADPSIADEPTATPSPTIAPEAQAAMEDYSKAVRALRADPAARPAENLDASDPASLQSLNNAIITHMQQIEDSEDRARAAMSPQERKAWTKTKKEIDAGD